MNTGGRLLLSVSLLATIALTGIDASDNYSDRVSQKSAHDGDLDGRFGSDPNRGNPQDRPKRKRGDRRGLTLDECPGALIYIEGELYLALDGIGPNLTSTEIILIEEEVAGCFNEKQLCIEWTSVLVIDEIFYDEVVEYYFDDLATRTFEPTPSPGPGGRKMVERLDDSVAGKGADSGVGDGTEGQQLEQSRDLRHRPVRKRVTRTKRVTYNVEIKGMCRGCKDKYDILGAREGLRRLQDPMPRWDTRKLQEDNGLSENAKAALGDLGSCVQELLGAEFTEAGCLKNVTVSLDSPSCIAPAEEA